ncbi:FkbM family methyltransferase [Campylobacter lari]|uniref:FkbM family methyltransferase n=1 Tax=Campylobacter lari TaxID=201 RepID=UPI0019D955AA|nr:FkbM family methyltransferase [Campylobacter lari]EGK8061560.1 FkbM family methyltransferase [Campylobacter lari]EGO9780757.1 FkbM family methyltransferase [Campylobacter lari]EKD8594422.1 FkbM family methyltransferase [Campylobacter lari]ELE5000905.1 FkbM family methyltransferase [Campylobacter lari]MCV3468778.1 FkbM family methyltransferase [Campylobacter lari]
MLFNIIRKMKKYSNKQLFRKIENLEKEIITLKKIQLNQAYFFKQNILSFNNRLDNFPYSLKYTKEIFFYLPNFKNDYIQSHIFLTHSFYSENQLKKIDKYLSEESIVLDIGANIGNHSIYWSLISNVKAIYSFEPIKNTFDILQKNIYINNIKDKIQIFNIALGKENSYADIKFYDSNNIGATQITQKNPSHPSAANVQNIQIVKLDEFINSNFQYEKIDMIKIDVEGFENNVLAGAVNTIEKYHPTIVIEIFDENYEKINSFFHSISYSLIEKLDDTNYIFRHID